MKEQNSSRHAEDCDIDISACATMDCTGLIPSLPQSEAELDSYRDLYPFEPPVVKVNKDEPL